MDATDWIGLTAFEAAGRLRSFTRAADELGLTQPAVSLRIRHLEIRIGAKLFAREGRGVTLSGEGRRLWSEVHAGFARIDGALQTAGKARRGPAAVTTAVSSSFASYWLLPRLPLFRDLHPGVDLRVVIIERPGDGALDHVDLRVQRGHGNWPGHESWEIAPECVFPVCSPDYLKSHEPIRKSADLARHRLIHLNERHFPSVTWPDWFETAGLAPQRSAANLELSDYSLVIKAAVAGAGVMLGWRHLVDDLIEQRSLAALPLPMVKTGLSYWLIRGRASPLTAVSDQLRKWMLAQSRRRTGQ